MTESPLPAVHPRTLTRYGLLLGIGMIVLAWLWTVPIRGRSAGRWFPMQGRAGDLALGILAGGVFVLVAWNLIRFIPSLKRIELLILSTLDMGALRSYHALLFGLIAGIPEEILFRGAIQPELGWPVTALLFGALHAITPAYFVYASVAGGLLGGLADWRGTLWAPTAAHIVIDAAMFLLLKRAWMRRSAS